MRHALTPLFDPAAVDVLTMIRENIDARNGWNARRVAQRAEAVKAGKCERGRKDIAAEVLASEKATELNGDEARRGFVERERGAAAGGAQPAEA